ncbi:activating transcription factor 7-interacting protein 2-like [Myzus persicae]|uniref:activating transcription factor 7-interacting protein 2-like n=1 Tax=Myzus persicae TaxID=13164 RepID=UPI000B933C5F|nr:activating transcription factor 7-interacting protein 2-like [Myzus persicae]
MRANAHGNSNEEHEYKDGEDETIITTDKSKIQQMNIIDSTALDLPTEKLLVTNNSGLESKINITTPDVKINSNDKVLPNTEARNTLSNEKCSSITILQQNINTVNESKSMLADAKVPSKAENKETVDKNCEAISKQLSNTTDLSNRTSLNKLKLPERYVYHFSSKRSRFVYPPPYPSTPPHNTQPWWKEVPSKPNMKIVTSGNTVTITFNLRLTEHVAKIKMYELFACQQTNKYPCSSMWKKVSKIEPLILPMGLELEMFALGYVYHFALRAVDVHGRCGPFAKIKTYV